MSNHGVTPEPIMRIASGFMSAKHLFAASQLGLFEALAESPANLEALAARTGLTPRAARISADAMVALGLLERQGDAYRNGETAATFLAGRTPADLRPFLRFWDRVSYQTWSEFAQTLGKGPGKQVFDLPPALQELASAGIDAIQVGPANALAASEDFEQRRRLLDVGGGTGSWAIAAARRHPDLAATVFDLPSVVNVARKRIADAGLSARVDFQVGDVFKDPLPGGHDVILLANIVHYWSPVRNRELLKLVRASAQTGARLLVADFWTNATHTEPLMAALMAGEFAAHVKEGDVYSLDEVRQWLPETGWRFREHRPLAGPVSVVVADAV
jgi:ubiquinone/menaquinone biosynthesis C-methylase UbiE